MSAVGLVIHPTMAVDRSVDAIFAAREEPELFATEIRAAFKALR
jgi:hypothetical protein